MTDAKVVEKKIYEEGKKHLSLMQRLRKEVAQAEEQKSAMLNDYMTNHSDKTWQEYLVWYNKTKKGETKK